MAISSVTTARLGTPDGFRIGVPAGSIALVNVSGASMSTNHPGLFVLNGQTSAAVRSRH